MSKEMQPTLLHSLGTDFSGIVVAVGDAVTRFAVGDYVNGMAFMDTYAEKIVLNEDALVAKVDSSLDLIPLGGFFLPVTAVYAATIKDGHASTGQRVLIHGGAGGVGKVCRPL